MALFTIQRGEDMIAGAVNAIVYGNSGVGKTSLVTALPWGTERWGDVAAYVAWDAGSETLLSVRPEDRKHLRIIRPTAMQRDGQGLVMNPYKTAMEIASADWPSLIPGCRTLIWDGVTRLAEQFLRAVANTGATVSKIKEGAGEARIQIGERGSVGYMSQPITSDYGMAQNMVMQWSEFLRQQPMNILVVHVTDYYKPEGGSHDGDTIGGPATVGVKIIPKYLKDFDNCFRLSIEPETINQNEGKVGPEGRPLPPAFSRVNKRLLWTEREGIWDAKIRKPPDVPNALARVELTKNPTDFWNLFDAFTIRKDSHATL